MNEVTSNTCQYYTIDKKINFHQRMILNVFEVENATVSKVLGLLDIRKVDDGTVINMKILPISRDWISLFWEGEETRNIKA